MLECLMNSGFIYWIALFIVVAIVDAAIAIGSYRRKQTISHNVMRVMIAAVLTTMFYACAITYEDYFLSSCFSSLYFIGVDMMLVFMLQFTDRFTNYNMPKPVAKITDAVVKIIVAVDSVVLLINPFKEIAVGYVPMNMSGHIIYRYDAHFLYNMHLLFCYLIVAAIIVILVAKSLSSPVIYRRQYYRILGIFIFVVFLNVLYLVGQTYFRIDISVLFYSVAAVMIYTSVFVSIPRSLLNSTRIMVTENMDCPLLVFDYQNNIVDSNKLAVQLLPEVAVERRNAKNAVDLEEYFTSVGLPSLTDPRSRYEWHLRKDGEEHVYQCDRHNFRDKKGRQAGWMLLMRDISYLRDSITGLDLAPGLYRYLGQLNKYANMPIQLIFVNVNGLGVINSALGHNKGNVVMARVAEIMQNVLGKEVFVAKMEDGTLVGVLLRCDKQRISAMAEQIQETVRSETSFGFTFEIEYGVAEVNGEHADIYDGLNEASMSMRNRKLLSGNSHEGALISSLTQTLLESDYETEAHVLRTKKASKKIAEAIGLSDRETSALALLCMLHDIGKVGIPTEILLKPGKLDPDEWEIMKTHTEKGYRIAMASKELQEMAKPILHHHERWDGSGYPGRLKGEDIPILSRIITVLDSFDVMTHDRPYHNAISVEEAKEEIHRCSGSQFDPRVVDIFLELADELYDE